MQRSLILTLCLFPVVFAGCGGAEVEVAQPATNTKVAEADEAIAIIRKSFDVMGGIERLRLAGSKAKITGNATANGENVPFEIMLGGPERYRLNYLGKDISYVHDNGKCLKILFGIPTNCSLKENLWITPVRILSGLTYPAGDAANLRSTFRMREETTVNGAACVVPEIRPKNTNLKIRAAYDKTTGFLAQTSFYFKDAAGIKSNWEISFKNWSMSKKMNVPFGKEISNNGTVVWQETVNSVDFDAFDEQAFNIPLPPTYDTPLAYKLPARRFIKSTVDGQKVEIIAPFTTLGGGYPQPGNIEQSQPINVMQLIHNGPVAEAAKFFNQLVTSVSSVGKTTVGDPKVMLLTNPSDEDNSALMIIYVEVVEAK